ncbi:hypothetical protein [Halomarina oriensis]|uniref:Uncharacterized protein n=1 Tax=Halomarina oriensis TaxID=671145 RepID=A0A6B0GQW6_9EURY|nr:hypothetical protein [Halomarina oriensis]MWG36471.1 hypothetical protein [Halomarina oriensis]
MQDPLYRIGEPHEYRPLLATDTEGGYPDFEFGPWETVTANHSSKGLAEYTRDQLGDMDGVEYLLTAPDAEGLAEDGQVRIDGEVYRLAHAEHAARHDRTRWLCVRDDRHVDDDTETDADDDGFRVVSGPE